MLEMDVDTNIKIMVPRNGGLEKYLLERAALNRRRNRLSMPIRNIPFGVRGARRIRNRRPTTIVYIGIRANPDNAMEAKNAPTPWIPPRPATPRPSVYRRLTFTPSPPLHVIDSPPVAEDSLVDFSFNDAFGSLSLDSN